MIKRINNLSTIYDGELKTNDSTKIDVSNSWLEFIKDKNPEDYFDGDIYCVSKIDDSVPLLNISKTKFSFLLYAKNTNNLIIRSLFSAGYIKTSDNYIGIILNNRGVLNTIGGMADNSDFIDGKYNYDNCLIREFKEELGFELDNDKHFQFSLKYLKYPEGDDLNKSFYPVGTLYEIVTDYTKDELIKAFSISDHENEVKELKFYNKENFEDMYKSSGKNDYLDELFSILFK